CGSYARYTRLEAEKKNITLYEVTIKDDDPNRVKRTLVSGHRINYFYTADNRRVYVDNTHNWRVILEGNEIKAHIKSRFGIDLNTVSFST
ncbi:MAG: hypothetical protein U9N61_10450, partial [Euryarchaeota archaeon]|nr:hypothetical protein [Euryarchaeota archaeon]